MEQGRMFLAIALSFLVIFLWQWFFVDKDLTQKSQQVPSAVKEEQVVKDEPFVKEIEQQPAVEMPTIKGESQKPPARARTLAVSSPYYTVEITERGATFKSFVLNEYRETVDTD